MPSSVELKRFEASKKMKGVMGRYFTELMAPKAPGKKIAWCTSLGPAELLGQSFGSEAHIAPDAQYTGAFGAALLAVERDKKPDA